MPIGFGCKRRAGYTLWVELNYVSLESTVSPQRNQAKKECRNEEMGFGVLHCCCRAWFIWGKNCGVFEGLGGEFKMGFGIGRHFVSVDEV